MRAGCLYLQIPISNFGKNARTLPKLCCTEHKLCIIIRYMHRVIKGDIWYLWMAVGGKVNCVL